MSPDVIQAEVTEILDAENINVTRIFNAFDPRREGNFAREQWQFTGDSLRTYIPEDIALGEFVIAHNGRMVPVGELETTYLQRGDCLVVCPVPQKGGGKNILGMVAMIAVAIFAPYAAGALAGAMGVTSTIGISLLTAGVAMAGSMLVHSLFAPSKATQNTSGNQADSTTYGIDGPKNTSIEGIPVPICYGRFRMAGNVVSLHVDNDGDTQILYVMICAGEGWVRDLGDVKINGNAFETYTNIECDRRGGDPGQPPLSWFQNEVVPHNVGVKLTTDWSYFTTPDLCDKVRIDLVAPNGLFQVNKDDGSNKAVSVPIEMEFRVAGSGGGWTGISATNTTVSQRLVYPVNASGQWGGGNATGPVASASSATGWLDPNDPFHATDANGNVWQYVMSGQDGQWIPADNSYAAGQMGGVANVIFGWRYSDNGQPVSADDLKYIQQNGFDQNTSNPSVPQYTTSGSNMAMSGQKRSAIRASFASQQIVPAQRVEVRVRRSTPKSTDDTVSDEVFWSDLNAVIMSTMAHPNTALMAFKLPLGDQINGMPEITFVNTGVNIWVYGKPVIDAVNDQWYLTNSSNPAWIVWDILTNTRYGAGMSAARLDFYAFKRWADYCTLADLQFNGVIDSEMNVWDATQLVLRIGHAQIVNVGTRYSVVVEKSDWPVMMFSVANMVTDSYKETWLGTADRANEIDVTYFDQNDDYKQRTIKIYDPAAWSAGAKQVPAAITLIGCISYDHAYEEGMIMMNMNRYVLKTVTFKAPLEAIACTVGDLIYVQHDMPNWAQAGRIYDGDQSTLVLDRAVTFESGKQYRALVHHDSIWRYNGTVVGVTPTGLGTHLVTLSNFPTQPAPVKRFLPTISGVQRDFEIVDVIPGVGVAVAGLDGSGITAGHVYELWDSDVIEERDVVALTPGDYTQITLSSILSAAPKQFGRWMFGETTKMKQIFRIKQINMTGDDMVREITALQYDPAVFDFSRFAGQHQPGVTLDPSKAPIGPVQGLTITEQTRVSGNSFQTEVLASWSQPQTGHYAGADVYVSRNGATASKFDAPAAVSVPISASRGEQIYVRVVAYDIWGNRCDYTSSPVIGITVVGEIPNLNVGGVTGADVYWVGPDCQLTWRYNSVTHSYEFGSEPNGGDSGALDPHFKDYEVKVWHMDDPDTRPARRTEYIPTNHYSYTFDKNASDGLTRKLRFQIRMRDIFNNLGEATVLTATNNPPVTTAISTGPGWESCQLNMTTTEDPDFAGLIVWMSLNQQDIDGDYERDSLMKGYQVYNGPAKNVLLPNLMFDTTYWFRVAAYDQFGTHELIPTLVLNFRTGTLDVNAIADNVLKASKLEPSLRDTINLVPGQAATISNISDSYTVKMGYNSTSQRLLAAGFGLAISQDAYDPAVGHSEFGVMAETFFVSMPTQPGQPEVRPFVIGQVDGVTRVIITSALIGDATIKSAKIGHLEVRESNISPGAVSQFAVWVTAAQTSFFPMTLGLFEQQTALVVTVNAGTCTPTGTSADNSPTPHAVCPITCTISGIQGVPGFLVDPSLTTQNGIGNSTFVFPMTGAINGSQAYVTVSRGIPAGGYSGFDGPMIVSASFMKK